MLTTERMQENNHRKHGLLDLKIENLAKKECTGMTKIALYRLVKEKSQLKMRYEA